MATYTKYYLAGPMTGIPSANIPAFEAAAKNLRARGLNVTTPVELDGEKVREESRADPTGLKYADSWGEFLARDVKILADELDAVIVLPGWGGSRGANLEVFVALLCGKPLFKYAPLSAEGMNPMSSTEAFRAILDRHNIGTI